MTAGDVNAIKKIQCGSNTLKIIHHMVQNEKRANKATEKASLRE